MTTSAANRWVVVSAVTVGGIYGFQTIKGNAKAGVGEFVTAWGVVFFVLALVATGAPGLAGAMAILIMVADLLANTPALANLITQAEGGAALVPGTGAGAAVGSPIHPLPKVGH